MYSDTYKHFEFHKINFIFKASCLVFTNGWLVIMSNNDIRTRKNVKLCTIVLDFQKSDT